jgi:hypothetical protein
MLYLIVHAFIFRRLAGTLALMSAATIAQISHLLLHVTLGITGTNLREKTPIGRACTRFRSAAACCLSLQFA